MKMSLIFSLSVLLNEKIIVLNRKALNYYLFIIQTENWLISKAFYYNLFHSMYKPIAVLLPPQKTLVTLSITLALVEWCLLLLNPKPFIRLESSAEARSTTPCAEIDDIFVYVFFCDHEIILITKSQLQMPVKCQLCSLVVADDLIHPRLYLDQYSPSQTMA